MTNSLISILKPENTPIYASIDQVEDDFTPIIDITDHLLENADILIDEILGKNQHKINQSTPIVHKSNQGRSYLFAYNIQRPQLKFKDKIDNSNTIHLRKIVKKYNSKVDLNYGLPGTSDISPEMALHVKSLGITTANNSQYSLPHPYEHEITTLTYPNHMLSIKPETIYPPFDTTECELVSTLEQLQNVSSHLNECTEIAIDLEHHDYRSFQGFTCLLQISSRTRDFIIDTLELREHLHILNESFTNPNICKVLHGAEMDIIWLQRDFGLYIVNLFDTYHASHALELNGHGLAYLLNYYCDLQIDKKYQLADWRIRYNNNSSRPLPQEMIDYARSDTHYLLYVYDLMRNELIRRGNPQTLNLIMTTLSNSANTSKKIHEKEIYDAESGEGNNGWKQALRKFGGSFEIERVAVFKTVHQWRDTIARQEDENIRYVLPNHMLCRISDSLPDDVNSLLSSCGTSVPPLLKVHAAELLRLIKIARLDVKTHAEERAAEWKQIKEEQAEREREWQEKKKRGPVHTRFQEVKKEDESNAKSNENNMVVEHAKIVLKKVPSMNIFGDDDDKETESRKKARLIHESLILEAPTMESLENESMHESKRVKLE